MGRPTLLGDPGYWLSGAGTYWSLVRQRIQKGPVFSWRFIGPVPERLEMVPPDLRPSDPLVARDIYEGRFSLGGRVIETHGASPFAVEPPSPIWEERIHGFRWLRHLQGADSDLASANARALVNDWMQGPGRSLSGPAWKLGVTAARVIAWMQYSRLLLTNSDHDFYRRFMASLSRQVRFLRGLSPSMNDDVEALAVRIALCFASQVLPTAGRVERMAARNLEQQLRLQILADGGHVNRCPETLAELLADLLPLAQCYVSASKPVPQEIIRAIDRMYPALRFYRHGDGHLAMFHGAGHNNTELTAAVLRHDQNGARPMSHAPHSGYQRLALGDTVIIADTGLPPSGVHASFGHASCLAFEMSSGRQRIVVNSGVDRLNREKYRALARMTAAHSTVVVEDTSSARFVRFGAGRPDEAMRSVAGPSTVQIERDSEADAPAFVAQHDGYVRPFGVWHERSMTLLDGGKRVDGRDRLKPARASGSAVERHYDIRFHLHPAIRPEMVGVSTVRLVSNHGEVWHFKASPGDVAIEDSIQFSGVAGPVRTRQIVVSATFPAIPTIGWRFQRN